jgi:copper chaperone CopZ
VQRALEGLEGVASVEMRFDDKEFDVVHGTAVTSEKLVAAVKAAGFKASLVSQEPIDSRE